MWLVGLDCWLMDCTMEWTLPWSGLYHGVDFTMEWTFSLLTRHNYSQGHIQENYDHIITIMVIVHMSGSCAHIIHK